MPQTFPSYDAIDVDAIPETPPLSPVPLSRPRRESNPNPLSAPSLSLSKAPDVTGPNPDVHAVFAHYNEKHFNSQLTNVYVEFSTRMTLCAGTCTYRGPIGGCRIALSEPLLKLRPSSDLRSTLLHEMIHAQLFNKGISRDGPDGHGPMFMEIADRINASEPPDIRITPYHTFDSEVEHYRTHHWKCTSCQMLIKRAMNRPPGRYDVFWGKHEANCGGTFEKIREPPKKEKPASAPKNRAIAVDKKNLAEQQNQTGKQSHPKGVMRTFRIDDMLSSKPDRIETTVDCPVCNAKVSVHRLNEHLDQCLSEDFKNDVVEVDVTPTKKSKTGKGALPVYDSSEDVIEIEDNPTTTWKDEKENFYLHKVTKATAVPRNTSSPSNMAVGSTKTHRGVNSGHSAGADSKTRLGFPIDVESYEPEPHRTLLPLSGIDSARIDRTRKEKKTSTEAVLSNSYVQFALNPCAFDAKKTHQLLQSVNSNELEPPKAKRVKQSFAALLQPIIHNEKSTEEEELAKTTVKPLRIKSDMKENAELSFVGVGRRLGVAHTDVFKRLRDNCDKQPDGSLIVPEDFESIIMSTKQGSTLGNIQVKSVAREARTGMGSDVDGYTISNERKQVGGTKMENCPVCGRLVLRSELEVHVNECLDGSNIKDAFYTQTSEEHLQTDGSKPDGKRSDHPVNAGRGNSRVIESANCPICDSVIPRPELEAHVNNCMLSAGLDEAF